MRHHSRGLVAIKPPDHHPRGHHHSRDSAAADHPTVYHAGTTTQAGIDW